MAEYKPATVEYIGLAASHIVSLQLLELLGSLSVGVVYVVAPDKSLTPQHTNTMNQLNNNNTTTTSSSNNNDIRRISSSPNFLQLSDPIHLEENNSGK